MIEGRSSMKTFLTTSDAARILEISADTVRANERRGKLHALKTAKGQRLFRREDVLAFKRARKRS